MQERALKTPGERGTNGENDKMKHSGMSMQEEEDRGMRRRECKSEGNLLVVLEFRADISKHFEGNLQALHIPFRHIRTPRAARRAWVWRSYSRLAPRFDGPKSQRVQPQPAHGFKILFYTIKNSLLATHHASEQVLKDEDTDRGSGTCRAGASTSGSRGGSGSSESESVPVSYSRDTVSQSKRTSKWRICTAVSSVSRPSNVSGRPANRVCNMVWDRRRRA